MGLVVELRHFWYGEIFKKTIYSLLAIPHIPFKMKVSRFIRLIEWSLNSDQAVVDAVATGSVQAAFVLQATRLDEMRDVCLNGEKMPQKSTYFYPKLITGLVINPVSPLETAAGGL